MRDPKLFDLFKTFVINAMPLVENALINTYYKPRYDRYPSLTIEKNGMPSISEFGSMPIKIGELFWSIGGKKEIEINSILGFSDLFTYLVNLDNYKEYFYYELKTKEDSDFVFKGSAEIFIVNLLERYYFLNKDKSVNLSLFEKIYLPIENFLYADTLNFDLSTPILFTKFDFEELKISENIKSGKYLRITKNQEFL